MTHLQCAIEPSLQNTDVRKSLLEEKERHRVQLQVILGQKFGQSWVILTGLGEFDRAWDRGIVVFGAVVAVGAGTAEGPSCAVGIIDAGCGCLFSRAGRSTARGTRYALVSISAHL